MLTSELEPEKCDIDKGNDIAQMHSLFEGGAVIQGDDVGDVQQPPRRWTGDDDGVGDDNDKNDNDVDDNGVRVRI